MLFYENLEEIIFHRHEMFDVDELLILSGYLGPQPVDRLRILPFKSSVIYGMYGSDSISERLHNSLTKLDKDIANTTIYYSNLPIHSKVYIWKKNENIVTALIGSANFSVSGLSNPYKEVLAETTYDTFKPLIDYTNRILNNCIHCNDPTVTLKGKAETTTATRTAVVASTSGVCQATLLDDTGEVPEKSGLNWGLSPGHTTLGDAYIPIKKRYLIENPDLFPPKQFQKLRVKPGGKATRQNDAVEFIWDDGTIMEGLLEQTQWVGNVPYPKAICSSPQKNILGIYLRNRLGVPIDYLITRKDLEAYGRTNIEISLQAEGVYYLDFSTNK